MNEVYVSGWTPLNDQDWKASYSLTLAPSAVGTRYICRQSIINNFMVNINLFRVVNTENALAPSVTCNGKLCKVMAYSDYYESIPPYSNITIENNTSISLELVIEFYSSILSSKPISLGNRRLS